MHCNYYYQCGGLVNVVFQLACTNLHESLALNTLPSSGQYDPFMPSLGYLSRGIFFNF